MDDIKLVRHFLGIAEEKGNAREIKRLGKILEKLVSAEYKKSLSLITPEGKGLRLIIKNKK